MGKSLVGHKSGKKHSEKPGKKKDDDRELIIVLFSHETVEKQIEKSKKEKSRAYQEKYSQERLQLRLAGQVVAPVIVALKIEHSKSEASAGRERLQEMSLIHFGRQYGNGFGAGFEIFGMENESEEHRKGDQKHSQGENQNFFPKFFQKSFFGYEKSQKQCDQNNRGDPEGYVGVDTQPEKSAGEDEIEPFFGPQAPEKKIKRENKHKRQHVGAKGNAVEVDGPKTSGIEKSGHETSPPGFHYFA